MGANVGFYTMLFGSKVTSTGRVMAFEASPRTHDLVSTSVEFNGFAGRVLFV